MEDAQLKVGSQFLYLHTKSNNYIHLVVKICPQCKQVHLWMDDSEELSIPDSVV